MILYFSKTWWPTSYVNQWIRTVYMNIKFPRMIEHGVSEFWAIDHLLRILFSYWLIKDQVRLGTWYFLVNWPLRWWHQAPGTFWNNRSFMKLYICLQESFSKLVAITTKQPHCHLLRNCFYGVSFPFLDSKSSLKCVIYVFFKSLQQCKSNRTHNLYGYK